ncbi:transposable element Tc1 transposase [Trichonephila clavipes]|nr:transposable element Tc1 transposase [Trichonephila clavipes]
MGIHDNRLFHNRYPTCSIMVWAGIMINGRTRLHVVANGTMTGQRYIDKVLVPHVCVRLFHGAVGDKFVFMDDNATCHRTLAVQDCLVSEGIQRLVWPACSPDLNPIENAWDALGRQVAGRNYPPTNKNTLIRALTEEWDKLPQQLLDNVVQSMLYPDEDFSLSRVRRHFFRTMEDFLNECFYIQRKDEYENTRVKKDIKVFLQDYNPDQLDFYLGYDDHHNEYASIYWTNEIWKQRNDGPQNFKVLSRDKDDICAGTHFSNFHITPWEDFKVTYFTSINNSTCGSFVVLVSNSCRTSHESMTTSLPWS